ncbi:MAG: hypothetical protein ACSHX0_01045 [Akkermansiaceae bacterium]
MKKLLLSTVCVCALSSCASIVSKNSYPVTFTSPGKPVKVTVKADTGHIVHTGMTPTQATLGASAGFFKPAKYSVSTANTTSELKATLDPWYAGNILFGGLIGGLIVDPATGSMWKLPADKMLAH